MPEGDFHPLIACCLQRHYQGRLALPRGLKVGWVRRQRQDSQECHLAHAELPGPLKQRVVEVEWILYGSPASTGADHVAVVAAVAVLEVQARGSSQTHVVLEYPAAAACLTLAPVLVPAHYLKSLAEIVAVAAAAVLLIPMLVMHNQDLASDGVECLGENVADAIKTDHEQAVEKMLGLSPRGLEVSGHSFGWYKRFLIQTT